MIAFFVVGFQGFYAPSPPREFRPRVLGFPEVRKCASALRQYAAEDSPSHPTALLIVSASPEKSQIDKLANDNKGGMT